MQKDLITKNGFEKIVEEFKRLLKEKSYWVKEKEIAAQLGDRSENAEYIAAKEQIRNTDKRLRFLDRIINTSEVIDISQIPHNRVNFGSHIQVKNLDNDELKTFIILKWTITFLIVAIIAGVLGFGGIAAGAASIAKVLFFIFIVLFILSLIRGKK